MIINEIRSLNLSLENRKWFCMHPSFLEKNGNPLNESYYYRIEKYNCEIFCDKMFRLRNTFKKLSLPWSFFIEMKNFIFEWKIFVSNAFHYFFSKIFLLYTISNNVKVQTVANENKSMKGNERKYTSTYIWLSHTFWRLSKQLCIIAIYIQCTIDNVQELHT